MAGLEMDAAVEDAQEAGAQEAAQHPKCQMPQYINDSARWTPTPVDVGEGAGGIAVAGDSGNIAGHSLLESNMIHSCERNCEDHRRDCRGESRKEDHCSAGAARGAGAGFQHGEEVGAYEIAEGIETNGKT